MSVAAPWIDRQREVLLAQQGRTWLLQGPSGLGQYELALDMVSAWLCEHPSSGEDGTAVRACGHCASCHAIGVRTHADLCVLMPEVTMLELGWPLSEKAQKEIDDKKRKPSREIRVEAMREAVEFSQRTSARGRGKAVLIYPAERMNHVTANALLKTLEEPAGDVGFVLASEAAYQLLATIRSRCLAHTMHWPTHDEALTWLEVQGVSADAATVWLAAAGGRPDDALRLARSGMEAVQWASLPRSLAKGDGALLAGWSPPHAVDALQKVCHDVLVRATGGEPRFFARADLPDAVSMGALSAWSGQLMRAARTAEHPFNAGLMLESLVSQARSALNSRH